MLQSVQKKQQKLPYFLSNFRYSVLSAHQAPIMLPNPLKRLAYISTKRPSSVPV